MGMATPHGRGDDDAWGDRDTGDGAAGGGGRTLDGGDEDRPKLDPLLFILYISPVASVVLFPFFLLLESDAVAAEAEHEHPISALLFVNFTLAFLLTWAELTLLRRTSAVTLGLSGAAKLVLFAVASVHTFRPPSIACRCTVLGNAPPATMRAHARWSSSTLPARPPSLPLPPRRSCSGTPCLS